MTRQNDTSWRELPVSEQTIQALLLQQHARFGDKPLVRFGDVIHSYNQTVSAVEEAAGQLRRSSVDAGDRVALMMTNRFELLQQFLAFAWLGAIVVPINIAARGRQLEHVLRDSGARVLVIEQGFVERLADFAVPPALAQVWVLDGMPQKAPAAYSVASWPGGGGAIAPADVRPGDTAALLYTSGTTGLPKGVCCPHAQFFWAAVVMNEVLDIRADDVLHSPLPLFHINALGTFFKALLAGATCSYGRSFSASNFWRELVDAEATVTFLLGTMVSILCSRDRSSLERAHGVRLAMAPATSAPLWATFLERTGIELVDAYGSTETAGVISAPPGAQKPGYMGRVLPDFEARVVDADDAEVPDGTPGELVLRNYQPNNFATGYFGLPAETVKTWRNLWFHTGDQVIRDADGWLRFHDRSAEVIRRRGENVSSCEVEEALVSHPSVGLAAAFGIASPLGEEDVAAAVVFKHGAARVAPAELIAHCNLRLAYFAVPRYLDFVDVLPTTENGKVRKAALKARGITYSMWDREKAG